MNKNPEQLTRDRIDGQLTASRWIIQDKKSLNLVGIREYQADASPAKYILFVNRKLVGLIEAKQEEEGIRFNVRMHRQIFRKYKSCLGVYDKIEETVVNSLSQTETLRQSVLKKLFN